MRKLPNTLTLTVLLAALPLTTLAEKPDDKPGNKHDKKQEQPVQKHRDKSPDNQPQARANDGASKHDARLRAPMGDSDRATIRHYFGGDDHGIPGGSKQKTLPPGLQKKLERGGDLPPGWQNKVARGEVLAPDLRRRAHRLPADLNQALHGYDADTELLLLEDRVVRVATGQGTVLDVIDIADILVR
jgi:hypothetical protein